MLAAALALGTLLLYFRVATFGFVNLDDPACVYETAEIRGGITLHNVGWAFRSAVLDHWKPLTSITHMLDCELFGLNAGAHHAVNVLWHTAAAAMLFLALERLTGKLWRSFLVAALFAWHPLRVESVAWITERKDVLSGFFWMATLWAYARQVERPDLKRRALTLALFALGLMSKSSIVTLPFVLVLLDFWPLRRMQLGRFTPVEGPREGTAQISLAGAFREKIPFFFLMVAASLVAYFVAISDQGVVSLKDLPLRFRLTNAAISYVRYLGMTFWPVDLSVIYPLQTWAAWKVAGAIVLLAAITWAAAREASRHAYLAVGWFWFLGTLVPMIGLVQAGLQAVADRYTYLPQIGLFIALVWGAADWAMQNGPRVRFAKAAAAVALAACMAASWMQQRHWRDSIALFEQALAVTPENMLAHNNLGSALMNAHRYEEAIPHFLAASTLSPWEWQADVNLGACMVKLGRPDDARFHYRRAFDRCRTPLDTQHLMTEFRRESREHPDDPEAFYQVAMTFNTLGMTNEAISELNNVLRVKPNHVASHIDLGVLLTKLGRRDEAAQHYRAALQTAPDNDVAHANLGGLLFDLGALDEAASHLTAALRLKPGNAATRYNYALLLLRQNRPAEAVAQLRATVELQPTFANALNKLAWLLATAPDSSLRNGPEALKLATQVNEQTGGRAAMALDTLAAALAECGRFTEALDTARKAHDLAVAANQKELVAALTTRIEFYQSHKPWRDAPTKNSNRAADSR